MSDLEHDARAIYFETLKAVDLPLLISQRVSVDKNHLLIDDKSYDLSQFGELILIGIGKASLQMGQALENILGSRLTRGLLVTNRREPLTLKSEVIVAGHPVPNAESLRAGNRAIDILANCSPDALVIFLISGGGSSLFEVPISDEITLEDLQELNRILVECGATIAEMNIVRKQYSAVKGGKLRKWMKAGRSVALFASDVNAGDLDTLASNPLFPETGAIEQFQTVIKRYALADRLPLCFRRPLLLSPSADPSSAERIDTSIESFLLAENTDVVNMAGHVARQLGFTVWCDRADNEAPYQETAARLITKVAEMKKANSNNKVCLISGGEVSCPVNGQGFGGRNQEFALYCAMKLAEVWSGESVVLSCGTDGVDGRSIAAGAIVRSTQLASGLLNESHLRDYFQANDTTSWFNESGGLIVTGPTGNNLRDLRLILTG